MGIYIDPETGSSIATHSMIKTFRRCPKQAEYKYVERLKPKITGKPLQRGTWVHRLLEVFYRAMIQRVDAPGQEGSVKATAVKLMWAEHARLSAKFNEMFDDEKDELGDLPREIKQIMQSYLWHYAQDDWVVHEAEFTLETKFPDGTLYRGKMDLLIEDQYGLWIVDHKTHARLPDMSFRLLDAQSALYIWAARRCGIPVQGHIWNYVRWKMPTKPQQLKAGGLSRRAIETDYLTFGKALKEYGIPLSAHRQRLDMLKSRQYRHGEPQLSPFFRRDVLEKDDAMLRRVAQEGYHTAKRMNEYPWDRTDAVERVPDRSCTFSCSYTELCSLELFGGDPVQLRKRYRVGDPMDYYQDDRGEFDKRGD